MNNYFLHIQYDGAAYSGWQIQDNAETVQQRIVDAIKVILKEKVNLIGSGRTDTGVHALGQIANFKVESELDIYKFKHSLNSILPEDISIIKMKKVPEEFHARFNAKKRSYLYLISKMKSPFYNNYSWYYHNKINVEALNNYSKLLIGEHNFSSFAKKKSEVENKNCNIYNAHWKESGELIMFFIEANRFLHGMVRTVVGTLLGISSNDEKEEKLIKILESQDREVAGETAPAKGLFLYKVKY
ncbi:MAG TPA: tRNA pseudouridine(38-40) synthase TruA [Ignavibacteriaceae bacterium]|nr:tRNA pseudouridine(38-40) synthase TruA [Ignavibacteriaceae bacterium]